METWDAIRARRNVRGFSARPIERNDLERILEAARRTPSAGNSQPWDLVAVTDRDRLKDLATVWRNGRHVAASAATVAIVGPLLDAGDRKRDWVLFDTGQLTMSLMLAAADLGIGSGHSAVGDQDRARDVLGLPEDRECLALIALGYPDDRPLMPVSAPDRRSFDDLVHWETW